MSAMPRFRLIQARTSDEVVGPEEHQSFADHMGVPLSSIEPVSALGGDLTFASVTREVDAVLVGGSGKYSVTDDADWLPNFFAVLRDLAEADFPTFASCFGFQGLCMALGAPVQTDPDSAEVGTYTLQPTTDAQADPVFCALPSTFLAQEGHKDRAMRLPEGAMWLARSDRTPFQAMRLGRNVYATQFHPELSGSANLRRFKQYFNEYKKAFGGDEAQRILDAFQESPDSTDLLRRFRVMVEERT